MTKLMNHRGTYCVVADQCAYGLVTPSAEDKSKLLPAPKPTRFMTNSSCMASQLQRRCLKDHRHQPLEGGRCANAAFYPKRLVRAILKGIAMQLEEDKIGVSLNDKNYINASPLKSTGYEKRITSSAKFATPSFLQLRVERGRSNMRNTTSVHDILMSILVSYCRQDSSGRHLRKS